MRDNIGNELHIGDTVFCLTGSNKNTVQKVVKSKTVEENLGEQTRVYFENGSWLAIYNVISLTALGITVSETASLTGCDAFGQKLHIDDKVLYRHPMEFYAEIGTVKKLAEKSCLLTIQENRFGQTEYRRKYEEIISLTAIGKGDLLIHHCHD